MRRRTNLAATAALALATAGCATAAPPDSGFLSAYEGLEARDDTLRAAVRQRRDAGLVEGLERVRLEPARLAEGAGADLAERELRLVLDEVDRQLCYELSERFTVVETDGPDTGRVRAAATRVRPTGRAASALSAVAGAYIPGPIGVRAPGTTGGLAAEAELLTPDGRQAAAIVWARDATVVGTDNPSLSRIGDAHQLAEPFADMAAEALAPADRASRGAPDPDPCARYGPRTRPEGFIARAVTGLYQPELSGGPAQPAPEAEAEAVPATP